MNEVQDAIRRLIPFNAKQTSRGWWQFSCPACNEKRKTRGNLLFTDNGGFRYKCFNGGCEYHDDSAGWEPGYGLFGRARQVFYMLGGDIKDIPDKYLEYKKFDTIPVAFTEDLEIATKFSEKSLPENSKSLWVINTPGAIQSKDYLRNRSPIFVNEFKDNFYWTPKYKNYVIIPLIHHHKTVGWIGRKTNNLPTGLTHFKCANFPHNYMYRQDTIYKQDEIIVQEGIFDAIALDSLCTFGGKISNIQRNLLKMSGKKIVLLPDFKGIEWKSYLNTARENNWYMSVPIYPGHDPSSKIDSIKDAGDAIKRNGLLSTIEVIMNAITNDYDKAEHILRQNSI